MNWAFLLTVSSAFTRKNQVFTKKNSVTTKNA